MGDPIGKLTELIDADDNLTLAAFAYQVTAKDLSYRTAGKDGGYYNKLDLQGKLEAIADIIAGRTLGMDPFPNIYSPNTFPQTFNLGNAINRTSELGVALYLGAEAGFLSAKWGQRGKKIAMGGALGGIFDDPISTSTQLYANIPSANYSANVRNGLPVPNAAPWTHSG